MKKSYLLAISLLSLITVLVMCKEKNEVPAVSTGSKDIGKIVFDTTGDSHVFTGLAGKLDTVEEIRIKPIGKGFHTFPSIGKHVVRRGHPTKLPKNESKPSPDTVGIFYLEDGEPTLIEGSTKIDEAFEVVMFDSIGIVASRKDGKWEIIDCEKALEAWWRTDSFYKANYDIQYIPKKSKQ